MNAPAHHTTLDINTVSIDDALNSAPFKQKRTVQPVKINKTGITAIK